MLFQWKNRDRLKKNRELQEDVIDLFNKKKTHNNTEQRNQKTTKRKQSSYDKTYNINAMNMNFSSNTSHSIIFFPFFFNH